jgi:hypothetical protein
MSYPHAHPDPLSNQLVFDEINTFAARRQTGVSLKTLLDTGKDTYPLQFHLPSWWQGQR